MVIRCHCWTSPGWSCHSHCLQPSRDSLHIDTCPQTSLFEKIRAKKFSKKLLISVLRLMAFKTSNLCYPGLKPRMNKGPSVATNNTSSWLGLTMILVTTEHFLFGSSISASKVSPLSNFKALTHPLEYCLPVFSSTFSLHPPMKAKCLLLLISIVLISLNFGKISPKIWISGSLFFSP